MPRPIYATIDTRALAHNLTIAKQHAPSSFLWGVIKANAYGHGIEHVYTGLALADGLTMVDFSEAKRVRALGWTKPILMIEGCFDASDVVACAELDLIPMLHSPAQLDLHAANPVPLQVHVKLNSDMNRLGFPLSAIPVDALLAMPYLKIAMWVTHFGNADIADGASRILHDFETAIKTLFVDYPALRAPLSTSNSAAIMGMPQAHHSAIRAGVMMYGASPFDPSEPTQTVSALGLRPVMSLTSQIIATKTLEVGDTVGYGSTFVAIHTMRIGIVACGYADGYPRHAPTGTPIAVDGIMTRTVGRVSMDMLALDLTPIPQAAIGSRVELWGALVSVDRVAQAAGTIGYELLCALAARVPVRSV
jgi:alanine racemase